MILTLVISDFHREMWVIYKNDSRLEIALKVKLLIFQYKW